MSESIAFLAGAQIVAAAVHVGSELAFSIRRFFNHEWYRTGADDFPVSRSAWIRGEVGIFSIYFLTGLFGTVFPGGLVYASGGVIFDFWQHVAHFFGRPRSRSAKIYLATAFAQLVISLLILRELDVGLDWRLVPVGLLILGNWVRNSRKVKRHGRPLQRTAR